MVDMVILILILTNYLDIINLLLIAMNGLEVVVDERVDDDFIELITKENLFS